MGCTGSKPATKAEKTLMVESAAKAKANGDNTEGPQQSPATAATDATPVPESQQSSATFPNDAMPAPESQELEQATGKAAQTQAIDKQSAQLAMPEHDQAANDPAAGGGVEQVTEGIAVGEAVEKADDGKVTLEKANYGDLMAELEALKNTTEPETAHPKVAEVVSGADSAGPHDAEVVASGAEAAGPKDAEVVASGAESTGPPADESQTGKAADEEKKAGAVEASGKKAWCGSKYCLTTEAENEIVMQSK